MEENNKKIRIGLRGKFILWIILASVLITGSVVFVGTRIFRDRITARYNDMAYEVAQVAAGYFTPEELREWSDLTLAFHHGEATQEEIDKVVNSDRYKQIKALQDGLRRDMQANGVYVCMFDTDELKGYTPEGLESRTWNPLCYISDSYQDEENQMHFGDSGPVAPDLVDDIYTLSTTGERVNNYFVANGSFGYNTTAFQPVSDDDGVMAVIGVEIPMATLKSDTDTFVRRVILMALGALAIILAILIPMLVYSLIKPVRFMAQEADSFIRNNSVISEDLEKIRTSDEIETLSRSLLKLERDVNEYVDHIQLVTAEKERIGAELNIATQIQADMLPSIFPPFPDRNEFDIFASMDPAKEVGGDFYDFFLVDEDHLGLVMADVSGKGVPAALFMVIAKTLIKNRVQMGDSPAKALMNVNDQLCEGNKAELFVTVWLGVLEISTGKGMAANAGHEHPVIRRGEGPYELVVYRHSPAVATMEGLRFKEHEFELNPGDTLFVYTDGVAEATNASNELYGTDRLLDVMNRNRDATMEKLVKEVRKDIDDFVGSAPQFDDITMLAFRYLGPQGGVKRSSDEADQNSGIQKSAQDATAADGQAASAQALQEQKAKVEKPQKEGTDMGTDSGEGVGIKELRVEAKLDELSRVLAFVDEELESMNCSIKSQLQIDVAVEEIFVNIASYAYEEKGGSGDARILLKQLDDPKRIEITFVDSGIYYDPLQKEDPDVTLSAEERQIGGLGIYMVKKSMDDVRYEYRDGHNRLTLVKIV